MAWRIAAAARGKSGNRSADRWVPSEREFQRPRPPAGRCARAREPGGCRRTGSSGPLLDRRRVESTKAEKEAAKKAKKTEKNPTA